MVTVGDAMNKQQQAELVEWATTQVIEDRQEMTEAEAKKITWSVALIIAWESRKGAQDDG